MPKHIAIFLNLEEPHLYTGHSFRRTSATVLMADAGADIVTLKRHGGWKSSTVAEGYIEDSIKNKVKIGETISTEISVPSTTENKPEESDVQEPPRKIPKLDDVMQNSSTSRIAHEVERSILPH